MGRSNFVLWDIYVTSHGTNNDNDNNLFLDAPPFSDLDDLRTQAADRAGWTGHLGAIPHDSSIPPPQKARTMKVTRTSTRTTTTCKDNHTNNTRTHERYTDGEWVGSGADRLWLPSSDGRWVGSGADRFWLPSSSGPVAANFKPPEGEADAASATAAGNHNLYYYQPPPTTTTYTTTPTTTITLTTSPTTTTTPTQTSHCQTHHLQQNHTCKYCKPPG